jgi:hypothetical protein
MSYWLGFVTGATVVTAIFYVWHLVSCEIVDKNTLEKDDEIHH